MKGSWYVYVLRCADDTLYTGVTTDVARRIEEHNGGDKGARYTRPRRPVSLLYSEAHETRSSACVREAEIKRLSRQKKLSLSTGESFPEGDTITSLQD